MEREVTDIKSNELRDAALNMQFAVGHVLANGGTNIDKWWPKLVDAQQRLASHTNPTAQEMSNGIDEMLKNF